MRFATLSAKVGSIGDNRLGGWVSYRASKAALNQIVRTASIEVAPISLCYKDEFVIYSTYTRLLAPTCD